MTNEELIKILNEAKVAPFTAVDGVLTHCAETEIEVGLLVGGAVEFVGEPVEADKPGIVFNHNTLLWEIEDLTHDEQ